MGTKVKSRDRDAPSDAPVSVGRVCTVYGVVLLLTAVALVPILLPSRFVPEAFLTEQAATFFKVALPALPVGTVLLCFCLTSSTPIKRRVGHFVFLAGLTLLLNDLHLRSVDRGPEATWQPGTHELVLRLDPDGIPHSYRFLPNSIARWFEFLTGDYGYARYLYRSIFMFLLVFSIYYYASLFLPAGPAFLAVAIFGLAYPISIRFYAGQLTDPFSHLSFILCFIFLAKRQFWYFLLSVLIGALAKETVVALAFLYPLLAGAERNKPAKSALAIVLSLAILALARAAVVASSFDYSKISGVALAHPILNLHIYVDWWLPQFGYTVGILLPFLALDWRSTPTHLRKLLVLLMPAIVASSMLFSFLHESRNYVPLVVPLGIVAAHFLANATYFPPWRADDEEWNSFVGRMTPLVVWVGWVGMVLLALFFTKTFAGNVQDLDHVSTAAAIASDRAPAPFLPWGAGTELTTPLSKFVFRALFERSHNGLLIAAYVNVIVLGLMSLAMILAAKVRRGRLSVFDVFFPLVLLNVGQSETLLVGTTLQNVVTVSLACIGLLLMLPKDSAWPMARIALAAGCVCLLTLCGIPGWALAVALALWLGYLGFILWVRTDSPRDHSLIGALLITTIIFIAASATFAFSEQTFAFAGWRAFARTTLEFLGVSVGPAASRLTFPGPRISFVGLGILALIIASMVLLVMRRERGRERIRHFGLLSFSLGLLLLTAVIGRQFAADGAGAGYTPRLATLAAVILVWIYLTWDAYGGAVGRNVMLTGLLVGVGAFYSTNAQQSIQFAEVFRGEVIEQVPGLRRVSLPVPPATLKDATWQDGAAHGQGADSQLIFNLERPLSVYAIRLTYAFTVISTGNPADYQAHFRMAWKQAGRNDFGDKGQNLSMDLDLSAGNVPLTILVNDIVDQVRIQPDVKDYHFQLKSVVLLVRD